MTAKSNAREGDGVAGLPAKWREQYEMHGLEWDAGYNRARTTCADELEAALQAQQGADKVWLGFMDVDSERVAIVDRHDWPNTPGFLNVVVYPATGAPR